MMMKLSLGNSFCSPLNYFTTELTI